MSTDDPAKAHVTEVLRAYILANDAVRKNPCGWMSCPPRDTPQWRDYAVLSEAYQKAYSELWMATDIEYDRSPFRDAVWNWRYWKVMARKCCWYQRFGSTFYAGRTMDKLQQAETKLVEVCGLSNIYRTACSYIEEQFPNLTKEN